MIIPVARITGERLVVPRGMGGREMDDKKLAAIRERLDNPRIGLERGWAESVALSLERELPEAEGGA